MNHWKRKVVALLHDPPHKPVAIRDHEDQRASFLNRLGLTTDDMREFENSNDWNAAAADRLIFPDPAKSGLRVDWKESWLEFRHPLGGGVLRAGAFPPTAAQLEDELTRALEATAVSENHDWRARFLAAWRLWPELSARERNSHFAYLVADTRIPDHTLWSHNALASAFAATEGAPAFLMFQIGPVQDFIAQARKTLDLWSGSYLLSYLIAQGMLAVAEGGVLDGTEVQGVGPDAIVFPQLRSVPLADLHWSEKGVFGGLKLRASHKNERLVPNLPNRFLALVPAHRAADLARFAENTIRSIWGGIADSVRRFIDETVGGQCPGWDRHWDAQVSRFPVIDWIVHPWPDTRSALKRAGAGVPPSPVPWEENPLNLAAHWARRCIPEDHRESYGPQINLRLRMVNSLRHGRLEACRPKECPVLSALARPRRGGTRGGRRAQGSPRRAQRGPRRRPP